MGAEKTDADLAAPLGADVQPRPREEAEGRRIAVKPAPVDAQPVIAAVDEAQKEHVPPGRKLRRHAPRAAPGGEIAVALIGREIVLALHAALRPDAAPVELVAIAEFAAQHVVLPRRPIGVAGRPRHGPATPLPGA